MMSQNKFIRYKYECTDLRYAVDNYVVMLYLQLPEGTTSPYREEGDKSPAGSTVGIALVMRDSELNGLYRRMPDNMPGASAGAAAHIFGMTLCDTFILPEGFTIGCNVYLTEEQLKYLVDNGTTASILTEYGGNYQNDPKVTKEPNGYDFKSIVSALVELGKVKVRYTDHEFREDERDFTHIDDYPLNDELSVESILQYSDELKPLQKHLISLVQ